jgi:putative sugar O-methyltransferase
MISNSHLLKVYRLNKIVKHNHSSVYWKNINSLKKFNIQNLKNFRKEEVLSKNLDDQSNLTSIKLLDYFKYFKSEFLIKNLPRKNVGNNKNSLDYLGFYFDYGIIHHLKWYEKIQNIFFENKKIKNICEIGGGFGSLARIILNNHCKKYILIDLPENNLLAAFFLTNHFPSKKIYLHAKKGNLNFRDYKMYDIFILPSFCALDPKIKIDFFINTRSFQEMNLKEIERYFDFIQTNNRKFYFLNVNRYSKSIGEEKINFWDYPYDNYWKVLISESSFLQDHTHFLFCSRLSKKELKSKEKKC